MAKESKGKHLKLLKFPENKKDNFDRYLEGINGALFSEEGTEFATR